MPEMSPALERSSWPHPFGGAGYGRVSPATLTARGQPAWSVQLAGSGPAEIVVAADGRCFVSSREHLTAVGADGEIDWSVRTPLGWDRLPIVLAGGGLLCYELAGDTDLLVVRDQATGAVTHRLTPGGVAHAAPAPGSGIAMIVRSAAGTSLRMVAMHGAERWSRTLEHPTGYPPLVWERGLALVDGYALRAYDLNGAALWWADDAGFHDAGAPGADERPRVQLSRMSAAPVVRAGPGVLVAAIESWGGGGLRALDVEARTVTRLDAAVQIGPPFALPDLPGRGPCVVTPGPGRQTGYNVWEWSLVALRLDGSVAWRHPMESAPRGVIADAAGTIVTWSTPTGERWSGYGRWFDLSRECVVRAVSAAGELLWTWHPPGPVTAGPVVGAGGRLHLVAGDRLVALD